MSRVKRVLGTLVIACVSVSPNAIAEPIEVVCAEFPKAQVAEMTDVIRSTEQVCAQFFGDDVLSADDDAFIELHRQFRDYENIDKELNDGAFRRHWGFTHGGVRQGHIALQPPIPVEMMDETGLPLRTLREIGKATVYLSIYRSFRNARSHPEWFAEGLAVYLSGESIRSLGVMRDIEVEPITSTEIIRVRRYFLENPDIGLNEVLNDEGEDLSIRMRHDMRGLVIAWFDDLEILDEVAQEARRLGGGSTYAQKLNTYVLEQLAKAGIDKPDTALRSWLGEFDAKWEQEYESLDMSDGSLWAHSAFSSRNAISWSDEELGNGNWALSGSLKIFDAEKTQLNVLLGKSEEGFYSVAVTANWGVTVFKHEYKENTWRRLANQEIASNDVEKWIDFKISKRKDRLMIRIGKGRPIRVDVAGHDLSGVWGLGCQNKSAGVWKDVKIER